MRLRKCPLRFGILRASKPSRSKREKWQNRRNRAYFCKGKGKTFPTHLNDGERRPLRKPKSCLLVIYMYEYFVVFSGRRQFANCIRRLILLNSCSIILFNRKIILFNYNPICKQHIFSHWTELLELWLRASCGGLGVVMFVFSRIQARRLWNPPEKASLSCKWHRKKVSPLLLSAVPATSRKHSLVNLDMANPPQVDSRNDFKHKLYCNCFHLSHSQFLGS